VTIQLADLSTMRLLLRALRKSDERAVLEIQNDPRTNEFNPHPPSEAVTRRKLREWLRHWAEQGYGYLAITETGADQIIGIGGVQARQFHGEKVLNLYYRFRPSAWEKGYASEATAAIVEWAEREIPERPVVISVNVLNKPSWRVAERLGFTTFVEEQYDGALSRHYRRRPTL
jgi:RimJ/RimL family protein N-acetyltransferase